MDAPSAWIQWKGTNVCADIRCECGELHHIDGGFAYVVSTPCGRKYVMGQDIPLTLVTPGSHDDCVDPVAAT